MRPSRRPNSRPGGESFVFRLPPRAESPRNTRCGGSRRSRRSRVWPPTGSHVDRRARLTIRKSEDGVLRDAAEARGPGHPGRAPRVAESDAGLRQPPSFARDIRSGPPPRGGTCSWKDRCDGVRTADAVMARPAGTARSGRPGAWLSGSGKDQPHDDRQLAKRKDLPHPVDSTVRQHGEDARHGSDHGARGAREQEYTERAR